MLDLIVLGIVPGTKFVVTFWWSLVFALAFSLLLFAYVEATKPKQSARKQSDKHGELDLEVINPPVQLA